MNKFKNSKKTILLVISALFLLSVTYYLILISQKNNEIRYVRKNANSVEAKSDIEAMNKALMIMKQKDCSDPLSWYYQGAIHWIPDSIPNNTLCESYHTTNDLKIAWDNCTHSTSGKEKIHFLVWHRLYIWHFEKIVRKLSGKKDFALPYWGYTNGNQKDKIMPLLMRDSKSYLFEACRYDSLNLGYPINGEIERALDLTKLMNYTDFKSFCYNINAAPHGAMHDYIGAGNDTTGTLEFKNPITNSTTNTGLMGWVPTAGFDPIFWLHHSNIDRIWQQWTNSENGKMITLEELKSVEWPYVFFDENGKKVEYSMDEVIKIIYDMDYDFDDVAVNPKSELEIVKSSNPKIIAASSKNTKIASKKTNININRLSSIPNNTNFSRVNIEMSVSFDRVPKGIYEVYVNVPENEILHPSSKYFVGFMNFFGFEDKKQNEKCNNGCCTPLNSYGRPYTNFYFELSKESISKDDFKITIYKHNAVTNDLIVDDIKITGM